MQVKAGLNYGVGDASVVVVSVVVVLSAGLMVAIGVDSAGVMVAIGVDSAGEVVTVVVSVDSVGEAAGTVVSVFCSHATRSAAPARMQMYFFIIEDAYWFN